MPTSVTHLTRSIIIARVVAFLSQQPEKSFAVEDLANIAAKGYAIADDTQQTNYRNRVYHALKYLADNNLIIATTTRTALKKRQLRYGWPKEDLKND